MNPLDDPRITHDAYVIEPTGYADMVQPDKASWCLTVVNGHAYGWSIRRGRHGNSDMAMNRKGEWVIETRGSGRNKPRRWPLTEALTIALSHVDTHRLIGMTAQEMSDWAAARYTERAQAEASDADTPAT